ncbi:MAG: cupin domain-containing protein [Alphaproteobacteria bacterium]
MSEADKLVEALGLQPHPEGGWFKETHRSNESDFDDAVRSVPRPQKPH